MASSGREYPLSDISDVVAFGHNELWQSEAAKLATKLPQIDNLAIQAMLTE